MQPRDTERDRGGVRPCDLEWGGGGVRAEYMERERAEDAERIILAAKIRCRDFVFVLKADGAGALQMHNRTSAVLMGEELFSTDHA